MKLFSGSSWPCTFLCGCNFIKQGSEFPTRKGQHFHSGIQTSPRWVWGFGVLSIQPSACCAQNSAQSRSMGAQQRGYLFSIWFTGLSNIEVEGDWGNSTSLSICKWDLTFTADTLLKLKFRKSTLKWPGFSPVCIWSVFTKRPLTVKGLRVPRGDTDSV